MRSDTRAKPLGAEELTSKWLLNQSGPPDSRREALKHRHLSLLASGYKNRSRKAFMSEITRYHEFQPHPLARGGQLQTLAGYLVSREQPRAAEQLQTIHLDDGDQLRLLLNFPKTNAQKRPIAILLHGLGGCADSAYLVRISRKWNTLGGISIRVNHRGCGASPLPAQGIYHSGSWRDVIAVLNYAGQQWPGHPLVLISFSLSATMSLNALIHERELPHQQRSNLHGWIRSIVVCPPVDLEQSSRKISRPGNRHIDLFYTRSLIQHCRNNYPKIWQRRLQGKNLKTWNLRTFDAEVTAPEAGFRDRSDYYTRCSPIEGLEKISRPTCILSAQDDPVVSADQLQRLFFNPHCQLHLCKTGGHMGFLARKPTKWNDLHWMDAFVLQQVDDLF